jgi:hypothetical protein
MVDRFEAQQHTQNVFEWVLKTGDTENGAAYLEYIWGSCATFSEGMSEKMKKNFGFVSLESRVYNDVTDVVLTSE